MRKIDKDSEEYSKLKRMYFDNYNTKNIKRTLIKDVECSHCQKKINMIGKDFKKFEVFVLKCSHCLTELCMTVSCDCESLTIYKKDL